VNGRLTFAGYLAIAVVAGLAIVGCGGSGGRVTTSKITAKEASRAYAATHSTNGLGHILLTESQQEGRQLFSENCGSCHTLSAAGTNGEIGPDLDELRPPAPAVTATIETGMGAMPPHLLKGKEAAAVADFVAAVTAH
jgi:mono/diheme cytochrome c family protein